MVSVRVGRKPVTRVLTNARTVGGLVDALHLAKRGQVDTQPKGGTALRSHQTVRVTTVRRVRRTEVQAVPFQTLIHYSRDVAPGQVSVEQAGAAGQARRTYLITFRNGVRASTKLVAETILVKPVDRIEVRGAAASGAEVGDATWYGCEGMHAAHKTLPFGTLVTVTNLDNGATVAVTINDRGPYADGRIIDLCDGAFAQIAPLGQGVAHVKITW
jgi:rare lipoprotein A